MPVEVSSRYIKPHVERELWARAAGRCEFNDCNRILYRSPVTKEPVNIAEEAHIWSFSKDGPRGWGPFTWRTEGLNDASNLMLMCHDCHKTIDKDKGVNYPAEVLIAWKGKHEERIESVTGINPSCQSHVILYCGNIGQQKPKLDAALAMSALLPDWNPASERPTILSMSWDGRDDNPHYWSTEEGNLTTGFAAKVRPLLEQHACRHYSVFGFAPIPLLVKFGSLFTDQVATEVYQLHREPQQSWRWPAQAEPLEFDTKAPNSFHAPPAVILSLSDVITADRVRSVVGDCSVWELTLKNPNNDFMKSRDVLSKFRRAARTLLDEVGRAHGKSTPISFFPAIPVSCAIELGRLRMPQADSRWVLYNQNGKLQKFVPALEINAS